MYIKIDITNINNGDKMQTIFLCFKIFIARLVDVSLGTIRTIYTVKEKNILASLIGLVEVTVWFLVVKEALNTDNDSFYIVFSYASGFAIGTYIGGVLSNKFIKMKLGVQVITTKRDDYIIKKIRKSGYAVSILNVEGNSKKYMLYIQIDSNNYNKLINLIKELDSKAFIVVNETKYVKNGYFGIVK